MPQKKSPPRSSAGSGQVLDHELVAMLDEMLTAAERQRILSGAEEQIKATIAALRDLWSRADLASLQRDAHKLAGLAGSVGCLRVTQVARDIEAACRREQSAQIEELIQALEQARPAALDALQQWRTRTAAV